MVKKFVRWQAISSFASFALALSQVAILARILELSDFGLVAIVMVVMKISHVLSDLGLANYLVYRQKITATLNATVFWISLSSGSMLFIFITLFSPLVADFYGESEVAYLLSLSAITFIPISLSSQLQARYICDFKLNELAKFDMVSKSLGVIVAVYAAFSGLGAESIIWGGLTLVTVKCVLIWVYADSSWKPKLLFSVMEAKKAWRYGFYQIGSQLISQLRSSLDILILGLYIDNTQLGAYSLAKQLTQKPAAFILPIIQKISLPLLASLQSDSVNLRRMLTKAHAYVAALLFLPYIFLCFLSEELVVIMYGEGKVELALFVIPLAIFWLLRSVGGALAGSIAQGLGETKIDFYWNLSVFGLFGLVCLILAPYGAYYLAWALAALQAVLMNLIFIVFYKRIVSFKYESYIYPILTFSILALFSVYLSMWFISSVQLNMNVVISVVTNSILAVCLYYVFCYHAAEKFISLKSPYSVVKALGIKARRFLNNRVY